MAVLPRRLGTEMFRKLCERDRKRILFATQHLNAARVELELAGRIPYK
jgi:hypothetical protein